MYFLSLFIFLFNQSTPKIREKAQRTSMKKDRPERTGSNNVLAKRKNKLKNFNMSDLEPKVVICDEGSSALNFHLPSFLYNLVMSTKLKM